MSRRIGKVISFYQGEKLTCEILWSAEKEWGVFSKVSWRLEDNLLLIPASESWIHQTRSALLSMTAIFEKMYFHAYSSLHVLARRNTMTKNNVVYIASRLNENCAQIILGCFNASPRFDSEFPMKEIKYDLYNLSISYPSFCHNN